MYKKRCRIVLARHFSPILNKNPSKKGQVTVFMIIGILLILSLILIISFRKEIFTFNPEEILTTEKGKIQNYIASCIQSSGEEAVKLIGLQGGYIKVPEDIASDGSLHLRTSDTHVVPYWAYGDTVNFLSLEEIKKDIDKHIEANIRSCLFGLEPFQETYDLREKTDITADTKISDKKIIFDVHWNIEVKNKAGEVVTELMDHAAESDIKLKKVYETSKRIIEKEMSSLKFEDITQDLLALEHPLVPLAGLEIACKEKKWRIEEVKSTLKEMLRVNIGQIKVKGTEIIEFPEELSYYQNHYLWDLGNDFSSSEISAFFNFDPNYPFSFDVRPRSGSYLRSGQLGGNNNLISNFCVQNWKFVYEISYPVLVDIRDETTGYSFNFAFTVHLKNNVPDRGGIVLSQRPLFFDSFHDEEFCQDADIPVTVLTYETVDNDQGVYFKEPLSGVDLTYTCIRYSCPVGETEFGFAGIGNAAAYRTNFPYCVGGILNGQKDGYKESWKRLVTSQEMDAELELTPLFTFKSDRIKILTHELSAAGQIGSAEELEDSKTVLATITYEKEGYIDPFHEAKLIIFPSLKEEADKEQEMEFLAKADFTYDLEIKILEGQEVIGGYGGKWTVEWEELSSSRELIFHVLKEDGMDDEERYQFLAELEENSLLLPLPEFN